MEYVEGRKRSISGSSGSIPAEEEHRKIADMFYNVLHKKFRYGEELN